MPPDAFRATGHHGSMTTRSIPFLIDYLYWMRDRVLDAAAAIDDATFASGSGRTLHGRDLRATLAHELDVEMSWRGKLQGLPIEQWGPAAEIKAEHFTQLAQLREAWRDHEARTRAWVATLTPADLDASTSVNGLDGRPLSDYLHHVVVHGATELAIASGLLADLGHEVGDISILAMPAGPKTGDPARGTLRT
jgi:uncharacterized damage-inducible protein DinB